MLSPRVRNKGSEGGLSLRLSHAMQVNSRIYIELSSSHFLMT
jgi:hypothetical protein